MRTFSAAILLGGSIAAAFAGILNADTLTLRSGEVLTGSWLGVDANQVTFMVDNRALKYDRSNVANVTFSGDAPTSVPTQGVASQPAPPRRTPSSSDPGAPTLRHQEAPVEDPAPPPQRASIGRAVDVFYYLDPNGPMQPIERAPLIKVGQSSWKIEGGKSKYRIVRNPAMLFVVRLPDGFDPNKVKLYRLSGSSSRAPYSTPGMAANNSWRTVTVSVSKAGDSYGFSPIGELSEGEYAFLRPGSDDAYCFGIDR
jgi:hypothetical protein